MEKVVVLSLATGQKRLSASLARVVQQYADLLVSQGLLATAQEYLSLMPDDATSPDLSVLKDRIYGTGALQANRFETPTVPWENQELVVERPQVHRNLSGQALYPPMPYIPTQDTPPYYQPKIDSPRNFPTHESPQEAPPRVYPPTGNTQSLYPNYPQTGLGGYEAKGNFNSGYGTSQGITEGYGSRDMNGPWGARAGYPSASEQWRSNDGQPSTPGLSAQPFTPNASTQTFTPAPPTQTFMPLPPTQPFMPVAPTQTFMPVPPSQNFMPVPPSQTFMPVASSQTFMPGESVAPPSSQTFMPVSPRMQPASGPVDAAKVPSPQLTSTPAPVGPPAPAPTVQNVDTSNISAELKPVVITLTRLYNETSEAFGGSRANPAKKREIDNNSRRLGALFLTLNAADLSQNASSKLIQLCQALDAGDFASALQIQVDLTTSDWDECSVWLTALKQMLKIRQTLT